MSKPVGQKNPFGDPAHNAPEVVPTEHYGQLEARHINDSPALAHDDNSPNNSVAAYYKPEHPGYLPGPYQQQSQQYPQPYPHPYPLPQPQEEKRIWGIKRKTFFIIAGILALLIVGGAVGGGVGAAMANKNKDDSSSSSPAQTTAPSLSSSVSSAEATSSASSTMTTATTTSATKTTSTSSTPTPTDGMGTYLCPSENGTTYVSSFGKQYTFLKVCNYDSPGGVAARGGGTVKDLQSVLARSMDSCIDQCAAQRAAGGACSAVSYGANITRALANKPAIGNCYLKDKVAEKLSFDGSGQAEMAYLVEQ